MKRLITLSGPAGRAILTLGEEIKLSIPLNKEFTVSLKLFFSAAIIYLLNFLCSESISILWIPF